MTTLTPKQILILDSLIKDTIREIDFSAYQNARVLISGAGGHLGIWLTLLFAAENSISNNLSLTIETNHHSKVLNLSRELSMKSPEILNESNKERFDVIFDMSLPKVENNDTDNYSPIFEFLGKFVSQKRRILPGGVLVIPSSGAVYGSSSTRNYGFAEEDSALATNRTVYGKAKILIEELSAEIESFSVPIFRIFSVFGPLMRQDSPLIGNNFYIQCKENHEIRLTGEGIAHRNMTFVPDIAKQIISLSKVPGVSEQPINLGSNNNLTIRNFANLVAESMGAKVVLGEKEEVTDFYLPILDRLSRHKLGANFEIKNAVELTSKFYL